MDGTTHECDILIGADGVRSLVRQLILGPDNPASMPVNSGWWAVWTLQKYDKGRALIGEGPVDIEDAREYAWTGDGTFLMHNLLSQGELMQFVVTAYDEHAVGTSPGNRTVAAEELRGLWKDWPSHLREAVDKVISHNISRTAKESNSTDMDHSFSATSLSNLLSTYPSTRTPIHTPLALFVSLEMPLTVLHHGWRPAAGCVWRTA